MSVAIPAHRSRFADASRAWQSRSSPRSLPFARSYLGVRLRPPAPQPRPVRRRRGVSAGFRAPPSLGLTWASTTLGRKLRVTSSCTAAAAPCPAPARWTPQLMLTSPFAAAGRGPWGRGTAAGPGDHPRGRLRATERLQGQRSARRSEAGECSL